MLYPPPTAENPALLNMNGGNIMKFFATRFLYAWPAAMAMLLAASCGGDDNGNLGSPGSRAFTSTSLTQTAVQELTDTFAATLTGTEEVPATPSNARGAGSVVVNASTRQMIATVTTVGINGTVAHIHLAPPGKPGPVIIPLVEASAGSGIWTVSTTLTEAQLANLRAGNLYFNVHSAAFPEGEIRGQILAQQPGSTAADGTSMQGSMPFGSTPSDTMGSNNASLLPGATSTTSLVASLKGQHEVPPTPSTAQGAGAAIIDRNTRELVAAITTNGINGTQAHIHQAPQGVPGPVVIPLDQSSAGSGIWIVRTTITEDQYNTLIQGGMYFNVHSAAFPEGEIRGQLLPQITFNTDSAMPATIGNAVPGPETVTGTIGDTTPLPPIPATTGIGMGAATGTPIGTPSDMNSMMPMDTNPGTGGFNSLGNGTGNNAMLGSVND